MRRRESGAGCGARGVASHASPGTLWVTVRRHNDRLPFSGLDVAGRAGTKARARDPKGSPESRKLRS
jgi:hypothetical protein